MANEFLDYQGLDYFKYKLIEGLSDYIDAVPTSRTVNGKALSSDISLTSTDIGAVPTSRTVNGKALSSNISLTASDVSALPISGGTLTGNLTIKGSGNYGTKINLGDGDYVHISEPTDDCMEIKAKKVNFVLSDTTDTKFTINGENPFGSSISLPLTVANGGTGGTTASKAVYNLTQPLTARTQANLSSYASTTYIPLYYGSGGYKATIEALGEAFASKRGLDTLLYTGTGGSSQTIELPWVMNSLVMIATTARYTTLPFVVPFAGDFSVLQYNLRAGSSTSWTIAQLHVDVDEPTMLLTVPSTLCESGFGYMVYRFYKA